MACHSAECTQRQQKLQVFVMPGAGHYHLVGGSAGGDDPSRYPWAAMKKSTHELDAVIPSVARGIKRPSAAAMPARLELWASRFRCPICLRKFETQNGVNGHMSCHTKRGWHAMEPPRPPPAGGLAADGRRYRYVCNRCRELFDTKQGLGGHRASHSRRKGCSWLEKQERLLADTAEAQRPVVFDFDLNKPAPEVKEEEEER